MTHHQQDKQARAWGFDPAKHQPDMLKAWRHFVKTGEILGGIVPDYIADSWNRSRRHGIDPFSISPRAYQDQAQYRKRIDRNKQLISLAAPIIENVFKSFGSARFVVSLYDRDGYHLIRLALSLIHI